MERCHTFTVKCFTPSGKLLKVPADEFNILIEENEQVYDELLDKIKEKDKTMI